MTAAIEVPAASRYRDACAVPEFAPLFTAYVLSLVSDVIAAVALTVLVFQRTGCAAAGALAEVVSPHIAIVVAAGCGLATIACFAPRRAAATEPA